MKQKDVQVGAAYLAKVSDRVVPVRIEREHPRGGWVATNTVTNKQIHIRSPQRLRGAAPGRQATVPGLTPPEEMFRAVRVPAAQAAGKGAALGRQEATTGQTPPTATPTTTPAPDAPVANPAAPCEARGLSLIAAAHRVLSESAPADRPMSCRAMVEKAMAQGYWQPRRGGHTPAATLYAAIHRELAAKPEQARFRKSERGMFTLAGQ